MRSIRTEALVIGSGFGAAPVALRLAEAGIEVKMIDKGPAINPYTDFKQTQDPEYLKRYIKTIHSPDVSFNYAEAEGGGSGFYEMMSFKAPSEVFFNTDKNGIKIWPSDVTRQSLEPYYDISEEMMHVEQMPARKIPKTGQVFALMMKHLGYSADRLRYAVKGCMNCGRCVTGCIYAAKQSMLLTYLPKAREHGMQFYERTEAMWIRETGKSSPKYVVHCRTHGSEEVRFETDILVLGAGTIGTPAILLRSRREGYLPNLSQHVGRNIAFTGSVKTAMLIPDWCPDVDMYSGKSSPGVASYEFFKSHGVLLAPMKPLPLQITAAGRITRESDKDVFWGGKHVELMRTLKTRGIILVGFSAMPGIGSISVEGNDIVFDYDIREANAEVIYKKTFDIIKKIVNASGGELLKLEFMSPRGTPYDRLHFTSSHPVGSCRMAESKERGVVDPYGEVFDYPGIYVTDGAALSGSIGMGPSLTIVANAERIADRIVGGSVISKPADRLVGW